jgi:ABC-2 type transport system ATP-binding protein
MTALLSALDRNRYDHDAPTPAGIDVRLTSDDAAAELLAGLVRDGVPVVACQPLGGALEATYLQLTEQGR